MEKSLHLLPSMAMNLKLLEKLRLLKKRDIHPLSSSAQIARSGGSGLESQVRYLPTLDMRTGNPSVLIRGGGSRCRKCKYFTLRVLSNR